MEKQPFNYSDDQFKKTKPKKKFDFKKLLSALVVIGVIISLGLNIYLITNLSSGSSSLVVDNTNATTQKVNYDVTTSTTKVIKKVQDSVVGVLVYKNSTTQASGSGSGVIYNVIDKTTGYIITNAHVVSGATSISVVFSNNKTVSATLVGSDAYSDVAVLKVTTSFTLSAIDIGDSDKLEKGETVLAIGSPLGIEYAGTVTQGIVSATDRTVSTDLDGDGTADWDMTAIQTDAAINPGNSGGAFVNMAGELVGITSMKYSSTSVEGMGFALPINDVMKAVNQIVTNGKVTHPAIGIRAYSLTDYNSSYNSSDSNSNQDGIYVSEVISGGAAASAGLQAGDIITKFDDKTVTTYKSFLAALYAKSPGDTVTLTIIRNNQTLKIKVTLGSK